jgi:hypothetical protein
VRELAPRHKRQLEPLLGHIAARGIRERGRVRRERVGAAQLLQLGPRCPKLGGKLGGVGGKLLDPCAQLLVPQQRHVGWLRAAQTQTARRRPQQHAADSEQPSMGKGTTDPGAVAAGVRACRPPSADGALGIWVQAACDVC